MANQLQKNILAKNLKYQLDKRGLSQTDLAKMLNYPEMTVSNWVNAKYYPRIDKIQELSDFFGINKSDLIEDKISKKENSLPSHFATQEEAVEFIMKQGVIAANTGININDYTDEEITQFANRLLDYARFLDNDKKKLD